jgi:hypothetical protein
VQLQPPESVLMVCWEGGKQETMQMQLFCETQKQPISKLARKPGVKRNPEGYRFIEPYLTVNLMRDTGIFHEILILKCCLTWMCNLDNGLLDRNKDVMHVLLTKPACMLLSYVSRTCSMYVC